MLLSLTHILHTTHTSTIMMHTTTVMMSVPPTDMPTSNPRGAGAAANTHYTLSEIMTENRLDMHACICIIYINKIIGKVRYELHVACYWYVLTLH